MKFRLFLSCLCLATKVYSQCNASVYLYVCIVLELPFLINSQYHTKYTHTLFRLGSAIVAYQIKSIPFLAKLPNNPLCFLIYSKGSTLPQDQEVRILTSQITSIVTANHNHKSLLMIFIALLAQVSLSFINNTAQVGSALYLQYMEQCSFVGFEEPSPPLESIFRSDKFYYRYVSHWMCC